MGFSLILSKFKIYNFWIYFDVQKYFCWQSYSFKNFFQILAKSAFKGPTHTFTQIKHIHTHTHLLGHPLRIHFRRSGRFGCQDCCQESIWLASNTRTEFTHPEDERDFTFFSVVWHLTRFSGHPKDLGRYVVVAVVLGLTAAPADSRFSPNSEPRERKQLAKRGRMITQQQIDDGQMCYFYLFI